MERVRALDLIRGAAILGVGLANVTWFAHVHPEFVHQIGADAYADRLVTALMLLLVDGKFVTMLALLFGVGLYILAGRRGDSEFPAYYGKRMLVLFGIGLLHVLFLWWGDILTLYAVVGILAMFFRKLETRWLVLLGLGAWLISLVFIAGVVLLMRFIPETGIDLYAKLGIHDPLALWAEGGFFHQMWIRFAIWLAAGCNALFLLAPMVGGLFLLGIAAGRGLPLANLRYARQTVVKALLICAPIGLGLSGLAAWRYWAAEDSFDWLVLQTAGGPFLTITYASILTLWSLTGLLRPLQAAIEAVGRLALTNYLTQSLIFAIVFTSYGFAMVGRLSSVETLYVVACVWAFNIVFSLVWLRFFEIGPVEWAWRSIVDGRARSLRKRRAQVEFEL